jgi:hypothetical protein
MASCATTEQHCEADSEDRAEPFEEAGRVHLHNVEEQQRLDALAEDHQKNEDEEAPLAAAGTAVFLQPSFNFGFHALAVAVHPDHHAEDKSGAGEERVAFIGVARNADFIEAPGGDKAGKHCTYQGFIDDRKHFEATGPPQPGDGDRDDESSLNALSQGDDENLNHIRN